MGRSTIDFRFLLIAGGLVAFGLLLLRKASASPPASASNNSPIFSSSIPPGLLPATDTSTFNDILASIAGAATGAGSDTVSKIANAFAPASAPAPSHVTTTSIRSTPDYLGPGTHADQYGNTYINGVLQGSP